MPPRSDEPRRDPTGSRRGSSRDRAAGADPRAGEPGEPGVGGISGARAYTPRGRTIREERGALPRGAEQRRTPRSTRSGDPFRPALQVLDGGRAGAARAARRDAPAAGRGGVVRTVAPRAPRGPAGDEPPPRRRTTPRAPRRTDRPAARRPSRKPPRPPKLADPRLRLRLGTALALALFATIGIRLVFLQAVDAPAYAGGGVADRTRTVELPAPRGAIYDRTGAPLAHSVEARYVFADPTMIEDPAGTAKALSPLLGISVSKLTALMQPRKLENGNPSRFEYLARGVEIPTAKQVLALELPGIGVHRDERRDVPGGDLAANLIGFTGDDMVGLEGLEARYDQLLRGQDGKRVFEAGLGDLRRADPGRLQQDHPGQAGQLPAADHRPGPAVPAQRILSTAMQQHKGSTGGRGRHRRRHRRGAGPGQPPDLRRGQAVPSDPVDREDAATSFVVDPGSVHKAIIFGAALQEGVITPDTTLPIANSDQEGRHRFSDTHPADGTADERAGAARLLLQRRHHQRSPTGSARRSCTTTRGGSAWASPPARGCRARRRPAAAAGRVERLVVPARCRSGTASTPPRCRWPPRTRRSPTTARTSSRTWSRR